MFGRKYPRYLLLLLFLSIIFIFKMKLEGRTSHLNFNDHIASTLSGYEESGMQTFDLIRDSCGDVCNTSIGPSGRGKYFDIIEKHIDCDRLFSDDFIEGAEQPKDVAPPDLESLVLAF